MTAPVSNVGQWDDHYEGMTTRVAYGTSSYQVIADYMRELATVEDWGCGGAALGALLRPDQYVGIDGSRSPFSDVRADLTRYHSHVPGVVLRHVLEHNDHWQDVLANAVASFTDRLIVVLFTPLVAVTRIMFREPDYGHVPVIAFEIGDLLALLPDGVSRSVERDVPSPDTAFGVETFIRAWR